MKTSADRFSRGTNYCSRSCFASKFFREHRWWMTDNGDTCWLGHKATSKLPLILLLGSQKTLGLTFIAKWRVCRILMLFGDLTSISPTIPRSSNPSGTPRNLKRKIYQNHGTLLSHSLRSSSSSKPCAPTSLFPPSKTISMHSSAQSSPFLPPSIWKSATKILLQ